MKTLKFFALIAVAASMLMGQAALANPPSWDTVNNSRGRFKVLKPFNSAAVLDHETGLVWEQSPDTGGYDWLQANDYCNTKIVGNRMGWRLPTIQELTSLLDRSQIAPALPPNHPFSNVQTSIYWAATTLAADAAKAWEVNFGSGEPGFANKVNGLLTWCVRGGLGTGVDPQ